MKQQSQPVTVVKQQSPVTVVKQQSQAPKPGGQQQKNPQPQSPPPNKQRPTPPQSPDIKERIAVLQQEILSLEKDPVRFKIATKGIEKNREMSTNDRDYLCKLEDQKVLIYNRQIAEQRLKIAQYQAEERLKNAQYRADHKKH